MAEAGVETSNSSRFFCHKCSEEIAPKLPEYVCPRCKSGFIEILDRPVEVESDSDSSDTDMDYLEYIDVGQPSQQGTSTGNAESQGGSGGASSSGSRRSQRFRNSLYLRHGRRRVPHDRQQALAPILQEVIMQMTSSILGSGGELGGVLPEGLEIPSFPMYFSPNLASNPGDYAWGRGGLDAIITQLMNQLDGTGPPPLPQEKIDQIPIVKITQDQCDKNLQCTVCMEDFKFDEKVRQLFCEHSYHEECIIPWLHLHGTCPVCRKTVLGEENSQIPFGSDPSDPPRHIRILLPQNSSSSVRSLNNFFVEEDLD